MKSLESCTFEELFAYAQKLLCLSDESMKVRFECLEVNSKIRYTMSGNSHRCNSDLSAVDAACKLVEKLEESLKSRIHSEIKGVASLRDRLFQLQTNSFEETFKQLSAVARERGFGTLSVVGGVSSKSDKLLYTASTPAAGVKASAHTNTEALARLAVCFNEQTEKKIQETMGSVHKLHRVLFEHGRASEDLVPETPETPATADEPEGKDYFL